MWARRLHARATRTQDMSPRRLAFSEPHFTYVHVRLAVDRERPPDTEIRWRGDERAALDVEHRSRLRGLEGLRLEVVREVSTEIGTNSSGLEERVASAVVFNPREISAGRVVHHLNPCAVRGTF